MSLGQDLDDLEAVHRVLAGDRAAFRPLVERYGDRILHYCRSRLPSDEEAADAAQEIFLRAFRSLASFRIGESFASWLFAIAANRLKTGFRRLGAEREKTERAATEGMAGAAPDPAAEAERSLEAEGVRRAVASLPEEQRLPVELYYFAGLSVAQVAGALGLGEEAVKSRLFRARSRLREILEPEQPPGRGEGILP